MKAKIILSILIIGLFNNWQACAQQKASKLPEPFSTVEGIPPLAYIIGIDRALKFTPEENKQYNTLYRDHIHKGYDMAKSIYEKVRQKVIQDTTPGMEKKKDDLRKMYEVARSSQLTPMPFISDDSINTLIITNLAAAPFMELISPELRKLDDEADGNEKSDANMQLVGVIYYMTGISGEIKLVDIEKAILHVSTLRDRYSDNEMKEWQKKWKDKAPKEEW